LSAAITGGFMPIQSCRQQLFPAARAAWEAHVESSEALAAYAAELAAQAGALAAQPADPDALTARVSALLADLLEPVKATALGKLGEGEPARRIAHEWV
jgi:hypothetical protein